MGETMRMAKWHIMEMGMKPTNRNARKYLHYYRKLQRKVRAEHKRVNSLVPRYEPHSYSKEENNG